MSSSFSFTIAEAVDLIVIEAAILFIRKFLDWSIPVKIFDTNPILFKAKKYPLIKKF